MPRLIDQHSCPPCGAELPEVKPRVCPEYAGSLCLQSGPSLLLVALGLWVVFG
ncbi:MAG: hypothetical protein GY711_06385 [bacterium]|nr:hypothetical protein [bacterium]